MAKKRVNYNKILEDTGKKVKKINKIVKIDKNPPTQGKAEEIFDKIRSEYVKES